MATFRKEAWNHMRGLVAEAGVFFSVYYPGPIERVAIRRPDGEIEEFSTPQLGDWFLAAVDGKVVIHYLPVDGQATATVYTNIHCGDGVGQQVTGGTGPQGPAGADGQRGPEGPAGPQGQAGADAQGGGVTEEELGRLADKVAGAVFFSEPAADHFGLPPHMHQGTMFQEMLLIALANQGVWQGIIAAIDEAVANMKREGYAPRS